MAEAKDKTVNEEPKVLTITEKVDDKDVNKQYLIDSMSDEGKVIYNKLAIMQKQKNDMLTNANFEIEKADVLINHYMAELKNNLPKKWKKLMKMPKVEITNPTDLSKLELHEQICALRYENIERRMESGSKRFVRMEQQIWGLYILIIGSQIIGAFI